MTIVFCSQQTLALLHYRDYASVGFYKYVGDVKTFCGAWLQANLTTPLCSQLGKSSPVLSIAPGEVRQVACSCVNCHNTVLPPFFLS